MLWVPSLVKLMMLTALLFLPLLIRVVVFVRAFVTCV